MKSRDLETSHLERDEDELRKRPGTPVDLQRILRALFRARHLILAAALTGAFLGVIAGPALYPSSYTSTVTIRFDGLPAMPGLPAPNYGSVNAYADGLYAEPVLMEVRRQLGDEVPASLEAIRKSIVMTADPQSGAIRAEVTAGSPEAARKFGDVLAKAFLDYQTEQLRARLDDAHRRLDEQLAIARLAHQRARIAWDNFRKEHGFDSIESEQGRIVAAAQLRTEAILAANEATSLENRVKTLRRELDRMPRLMVSQQQEAAPEATRLADLEAELAAKESRLTPAHPEVQALRRQAQMLRLRLNDGRAKTVSTQILGPNAERSTVTVALAEAESALAAARGRAEGLKRHAEMAEEKIASFSAVEGQALVLLANLNVQRELENRLEGERARVAAAILEPESGFMIIKPAHLPHAANPNKFRVIATVLVPILVTLLAVLVVLVRELRGFRVETPAELAYWADAPVIGATSWPNEPGCLEELIEGLDDFVPRARGEVLVVGASAWDAALSETIAARLGADWLADTKDEEVTEERGGGSELSLREGTAIEKRSSARLRAVHWGGESRGPSLRRAARLVDRVLVVVSSGAVSATDLLGLKRRLGRDHGVGLVVVNVPPHYQNGPDRVGEVAEFWAVG